MLASAKDCFALPYLLCLKESKYSNSDMGLDSIPIGNTTQLPSYYNGSARAPSNSSATTAPDNKNKLIQSLCKQVFKLLTDEHNTPTTSSSSLALTITLFLVPKTSLPPHR